jgi:hypothetical protein
MGSIYFVFLFRRGTEQPRQGDMNNSTSPNMFPIHKKSDQTRSGTTILQLLLCTAYKIKMVGDDYPFMLQCLVYRKKGTVTVHHWGILTHPWSCPLFMFVEPPQVRYLDLHKYLDDPIVFLPLPTAHNTLKQLNRYGRISATTFFSSFVLAY